MIKTISAIGLALLTAQAHAISIHSATTDKVDTLIYQDRETMDVVKTGKTESIQVASASCQAWMAELPSIYDNDGNMQEIHRLEGIAQGFQCN